MRHWQVIGTTDPNDGPLTMQMAVWEDDLPDDPGHDCRCTNDFGAQGCKPPKDEE